MKVVHEVKMIFLITKLHLLFSLSFSQQCTGEFSKGYMICANSIALTASDIFKSYQFFSYNTINICKNINKISLESSINSKSVKGS